MERPLDELEKLILRHLASGPHSASELADALRQYGVAPSRPAVVYRLGGLVSLKLVASAERKPQRGGAEFIYSLRSEPKAEPPKAEPPKEDAPPIQAPPKATKGASKSPSNARQDTPLTKAQLDARLALIKQRHRALLASGRIQGGHLQCFR